MLLSTGGLCWWPAADRHGHGPMRCDPVTGGAAPGRRLASEGGRPSEGGRLGSATVCVSEGFTGPAVGLHGHGPMV